MKISQRQARSLRTRVEQLEEQLNMQRRSWVSDWPGGTHIATIDISSCHVEVAKIQTARRLGHAVVATETSPTRIEFRALPLPVKP